jgi:hypothetical protein
MTWQHESSWLKNDSTYKITLALPQGCQIFLGANIENIPNGNKIYQMYRHLQLQDPPKFYPNWDFWFENIPSGNPALPAFALNKR